jgi:hypothetical protein
VRADTAFRNERLQRGLVVGSLCPKVAAAIPRSRERNTQGAALPPVLTPPGRTLACCSSVVLGLGRKLAPVTLGGIQPHVAWPDGFVAVIALLVPLASSASEAPGYSCPFHTFPTGAGLGDSRESHKDAHDTIGAFVTPALRQVREHPREFRAAAWSSPQPACRRATGR